MIGATDRRAAQLTIGIVLVTNVGHARGLDATPLLPPTICLRASADILLSFVTGLGDVAKLKGVADSITCANPVGLMGPTRTMTTGVTPLRTPEHPAEVIQGAVVGNPRCGPTGSTAGTG